MWKILGQFILKFRFLLLLILLGSTVFMAFQAKKVQLSYEFANAIPTDHPKYKAYQEFRKKFGEDGNMLVIGIQADNLFEQATFNNYKTLIQKIKKSDGVEDIISLTTALNLIKNSETEKLSAQSIFGDSILTQAEIDSCKNIFLSLPFYRNLLYNPETNAWLIGVKINKQILASKKREKVVSDITELANAFGVNNKLEIHLSGLPLIRTVLAKRIADEMRWFLIASVLLSAIILLLFFKAFSTDRKSTRLNSSHERLSRMPSSA